MEGCTIRSIGIDFSDLADRVADDIYSKRLTIKQALEDMPLGNRAELKRWRSLVWSMFESVINGQDLPPEKGRKSKKNSKDEEHE